MFTGNLLVNDYSQYAQLILPKSCDKSSYHKSKKDTFYVPDKTNVKKDLESLSTTKSVHSKNELILNNKTKQNFKVKEKNEEKIIMGNSIKIYKSSHLSHNSFSSSGNSSMKMNKNTERKMEQWFPMDKNDLAMLKTKSYEYIQNVKSANLKLKNCLSESIEMTNIINIMETKVLSISNYTSGFERYSNSDRYEHKPTSLDSRTNSSRRFMEKENCFPHKFDTKHSRHRHHHPVSHGNFQSRKTVHEVHEAQKNKNPNDLSRFMNYCDDNGDALENSTKFSSKEKGEIQSRKRNADLQRSLNSESCQERKERRSFPIKKSESQRKSQQTISIIDTMTGSNHVNDVSGTTISRLKNGFNYDLSTEMEYNNTVVKDLLTFIGQTSDRKLQLDRSMKKKMTELKKEQMRASLELTSGKGVVVNEEYKKKYLDYVTLKIDKLNAQLKRQDLFQAQLSPIIGCQNVTEVYCQQTSNSVVSVHQKSASVSQTNVSFDLYQLENFLAVLQDSIDFDKDNFDDSLNDKPTDPKFSYLRCLIPWKDETVVPLIDLAIEQLFVVRQQRDGKTLDAFRSSLENVPEKFKEANSDDEINRIYNQWIVHRISDKNYPSDEKYFIDRIRIYHAVHSVMEDIYRSDDDAALDPKNLKFFDKERNRKIKLWEGLQPPTSLSKVKGIIKKQLMLRNYISVCDHQFIKRPRKYQLFLDCASDNVERMVIEEELNNNLCEKFYNQAVEIFHNLCLETKDKTLSWDDVRDYVNRNFLKK